jgi:hypothetical protein
MMLVKMCVLMGHDDVDEKVREAQEMALKTSKSKLCFNPNILFPDHFQMVGNAT